MANTTDDSNKNTNDEDNFGLPDIEYKPLDQLDPAKPAEDEPAKGEETSRVHTFSKESIAQETPVYEEDEDDGGSKSGMVITVLIGLVVVVAAFLIYKFVYLPKEKAKQELLAKEKADAAKKAEDERLAKLAEEERLKREAAANTKPAIGTIETLTARTGHYYVIVTSDIDGDLVMDYAKKLSAKGTGSKIIPPFGKWKFYRLGIGDYDSFASAQSSADASKADYGNALWVMKY